jgi:sigma-B regulation protein RsbU (phosphoserine phosphatase)
MGKGGPAALLATVMRTAVYARLNLAMEPGRLLTEVNHQIASDLSQVDMFITAQIACLLEKENSLLLSNAGHCPLLHHRLAEDRISQLIVEGTPLGVIDNFDYREERYRVERGDRLLFLTDGVYEVEDAAGDILGIDRLAQKVRSDLTCAPADLCGRILDFVHAFSGGRPAADDRTLLAVERAD